MAKVDLYSPLTPEECVDRLRAVLSNPSGEIEGRVEGDQVRLRKRVFRRTSFRPYLHAKLLPHCTGTRLRVSFGPHPLLNGFVGVWFVFLCLGGLFALWKGTYLPNLIVYSSLVLGAVGMMWLGRLLARGQERTLMECVTSVVKAETVTVK